MATKFEINDLAYLKYFLRIEVSRSKHEVSLSERKYVLDFFIETRMLDCKHVKMPIKINKN